MPVTLSETVGRVQLHLVRHGRTVFNTDGLIQGWCDSPLTADGLARVRALAQALARRPFAAAYASPSPRAVTTAQEILRHHPGVSLTVDDGLREMHFGDYEGRPLAEVFTPAELRTMFEDVFTGNFVGLPGAAESTGEYLDRVGAAFGRIERSRDDGAPVLVVGHGVTLLSYVASATSAAITPLDNATLTVLDVAPGHGRRLRGAGMDAAAVARLDDLETGPTSSF